MSTQKAGSLLLDTSVVVAHFRNDRAVTSKLSHCESVFLSSISLGELLYGARFAPAPQQEVQRVHAFADAVPVLAADRETADVYGRLKLSLRRRGKMIPENDIWIAAIARQFGIALATRDSHFKECEDLLIELW